MKKETMTSKERWLAVLQGEKPDRLPMDYWATDEANAKLMKHLGCVDMQDVYKKLHIDAVITIAPDFVGPSEKEVAAASGSGGHINLRQTRSGHIQPPTGKENRYDVFGCGFADIPYENGVYKECVEFPLQEYQSVEEIEADYTWPSPDWFDYSGLDEKLRGKENYIIEIYGHEPGWKYNHLRGMEQALMDYMLNPEIAHYCHAKMHEYFYEIAKRIFETIPGKVQLCYVAEDFGSQTSLLYSPDVIREFFFPQKRELIKLIHQAGAYAFHHDDGAIKPIIPELIDVGIDILNPIQWRTPGMDRGPLKREYGDKLVLHGGMDNQYTLAFGSKDEVEQEVRDNIEILGKDGGYVLAPCHNIQAVSPPENIVTMYETCFKEGWY